MNFLLSLLIFSELSSLARAQNRALPNVESATTDHCIASVREYGRGGATRLDTYPMIKRVSNAGTYFEVEKEGCAFTALDAGRYLLVTISQAPDYMTGMTSRGNFDASGEYSMAISLGNKVSRIDCKQNK